LDGSILLLAGLMNGQNVSHVEEWFIRIWVSHFFIGDFRVILESPVLSVILFNKLYQDIYPMEPVV
jgi:hypothetical protein